MCECYQCMFLSAELVLSSDHPANICCSLATMCLGSRIRKLDIDIHTWNCHNDVSRQLCFFLCTVSFHALTERILAWRIRVTDFQLIGLRYNGHSIMLIYKSSSSNATSSVSAHVWSVASLASVFRLGCFAQSSWIPCTIPVFCSASQLPSSISWNVDGSHH